MKTRQVQVVVPASTANLGPGFDCLGLALSLHNTIEVELSDQDQKVEITVEGEGANLLPRDNKNLILESISIVAGDGLKNRGLRIKAASKIPLSSGLGSSAAATVAGLVAANALFETNLSPEELLSIAAEKEGHPDNAAAALFGGLVAVSGDGKTIHLAEFDIAPLQVVIALPALQLSTVEARKVLPKQVSLKDAVANMGGSIFVLKALETGDFDQLRWAMKDRWHQPYRELLIPGFHEVSEAALKNGAAAVTLSGAGPSLAAFAPEGHQKIAAAMASAFQAKGISCRTFILPVDQKGAQVKLL
ncbi:MAG: homoserine kinase [Deltaproteobacteria bacterium]|nr:homoserine kinase [Deltaproteobacteria bacterium]